MDVFESSFRGLIGLPCWGVQWDAQTGLWLEFGTPRLTIREPKEVASASERVRRLFAHRRVTLHGRWTLAITCGRWRLSLRGQDGVSHASEDADVARALVWLDGQNLLSVEVAAEDGTTQLRFDLGAELTVAGSDCDEGEMWTLYKPRGMALSVRRDGTYGSGSASKAHRWRSIPRYAEPMS